MNYQLISRSRKSRANTKKKRRSKKSKVHPRRRKSRRRKSRRRKSRRRKSRHHYSKKKRRRRRRYSKKGGNPPQIDIKPGDILVMNFGGNVPLTSYKHVAVAVSGLVNNQEKTFYPLHIVVVRDVFCLA